MVLDFFLKFWYFHIFLTCLQNFKKFSEILITYFFPFSIKFPGIALLRNPQLYKESTFKPLFDAIQLLFYSQEKVKVPEAGRENCGVNKIDIIMRLRMHCPGKFASHSALLQTIIIFGTKIIGLHGQESFLRF